MEVTRKFKMPYEKDLYNELRLLQKESAKVWNQIVRESKSYYFATKKWLSKNDIQSSCKQNFELHSQTVQAITDKFDANRKTIQELRKTGNTKAKYPWKFKSFYCVPFKQSGFDVSKKQIALKCVNYESSLVKLIKHPVSSKKQNPIKKKNQEIIIPNLAKDDLTNVSYVELVYNQGSYWFHYVIEVQEEKNDNSFKAAGGDLGQIHAIAVATEDKALVISGRAMRSIQQFRAKAMAELSKKMSRCKKYSRQWKKYKSAKCHIREKSNQQLDYLEHKISRETVNFLVQEKVTDFVLGDVSGIEKNTVKNSKRKSKTTKSRRQQLSSWSYGKLSTKLKYKCDQKSIQLTKVKENYTSQDCPFCNGRHKANGRNFYCSVHNKTMHRDVNGSQNITRKLHPVVVRDVQIKFIQPVWHKSLMTPYERQLAKKPKDVTKYRRIATA